MIVLSSRPRNHAHRMSALADFSVYIPNVIYGGLCKSLIRRRGDLE